MTKTPDALPPDFELLETKHLKGLAASDAEYEFAHI